MHYVPVSDKIGLGDVVPKIMWLRDHDDVARRIAEAGRALALTHGSSRCVSAVWAAALQVLVAEQDERMWQLDSSDESQEQEHNVKQVKHDEKRHTVKKHDGHDKMTLSAEMAMRNGELLCDSDSLLELEDLHPGTKGKA